MEGNDIRLVIVGPIGFFSNFILTTCSGKHLKDNSHAHVVSLMYKLLAPSGGGDDLSIGFDRDRNRRQKELPNNNNHKGGNHVRFMLADMFGFAEH